jgi:hypothetical protein
MFLKIFQNTENNLGFQVFENLKGSDHSELHMRDR